MKDRFCKIYTSSITRDGADRMLKWLENSDFFTAPASTRFHDTFPGGLCAHSLRVHDEMQRLAALYRDTARASQETIAIISLLHDVCKVNCYKHDTRNVKVDGTWTTVPFYRFEEDMPMGFHGPKSVFIISQFMELSPVEMACIANHMGAYGAMDGGRALSSVFDKYPLALLLHAADTIAAHVKEEI